MVDKPVALEIHPGQTESALRIPARDTYEVIADAEHFRVPRDTVRHDDWYRPQHELTEDHVMDNPPSVDKVTPGQDVREFLRPERLERPIVDRDTRKRA